jgi:hypothetical protein
MPDDLTMIAIALPRHSMASVDAIIIRRREAAGIPSGFDVLLAPVDRIHVAASNR